MTNYRYEATSVIGFIQQLASNMLSRGYYFYVTGVIPTGKDPTLIDQKLLTKYNISISRQSRARRKQLGRANVHYLRHDRFFVLLATHGEHPFFKEEGSLIKDARRIPIQYAGYSLSVKQGNFLKKVIPESSPIPDQKLRVRVQIARKDYQLLIADFLERARRTSTENLSRELYCLPYEPYSPIRKQLLNLLRLINQTRKQAGMEMIPTTVLRYQREITKVYAAGQTPEPETFDSLKLAS